MNFLIIPFKPDASREVKLFLATCIVKVDPPPASEAPASCPSTAFANLGASTPLCWKNLESSVATIASTNTSGSSSYSSFSRLSLPSLAIMSFLLS